MAGWDVVWAKNVKGVGGSGACHSKESACNSILISMHQANLLDFA